MVRPQEKVRTEADLARLLLDFAHAPGRYAIRLGEPHALFRELRTLVRWAQGRLPDKLTRGDEALDERELVRAAVLFIQRACFDRDSTHYQVMGLTPGMFSQERLRARYRVLIRLTHPDIGVGGLPANAAGMVNRAYDVLSDDDARRRYDDELANRQRRRPALASADDDSAGFGFTMMRGGDLLPGIHAAPPLRERWTTWIAGHPSQVRLALVLASAGVLLGGVFVWAALDTAHGAGSVLVAAQPAAAQPAAAQPAPPPAPAAAVEPGGRAAARDPTDGVPAAPVLAALAAEPADPGAAPMTTDLTAPAPTAEPGAAELADAALEAPDPLPIPVAQVAAAPLAPAAAPAPVPRAAPPRASPAPPAEPARRVARAAAATRSQVRPSKARTAAAPEPTATWEVDARGARDYLDDIVSALQQADNTQNLNSYLAHMNVKGSLLTPLAELHRRSPRLAVERTAWTEARRPGALDLRSTLVVQAPTDGAGISVYRLKAEFRGTPEGTVLERLDLRAGH